MPLVHPSAVPARCSRDQGCHRQEGASAGATSDACKDAVRPVRYRSRRHAHELRCRGFHAAVSTELLAGVEPAPVVRALDGRVVLNIFLRRRTLLVGRYSGAARTKHKRERSSAEE